MTDTSETIAAEDVQPPNLARPLMGRRALVTGASSGIGQGIADELARRGADVAFVYIGEPSPAKTVDAVEQHHRRAFALEADLRDPAACAAAVNDAADALGGLDILVNNAGVTVYAPIEQTPLETYESQFALNVRSQFLTIKQALPYLRKRRQGASIVNISSIQAFAAIAPSAVYGATKGAVNSFTQHLAVELAESGIRVNAVAPGLTETPRYFDDPEYSTDRGNKLVPRGRVGYPKDIAAAVAFLASDEADFVTGQIISVDGGTTAKLALTGFGADDT
ncbi:MAG TPA: glucose 1-dehydrogenase [Nitrolancea sp.]|jgi:glucose 1-dehydrogenase/3-oxoacyl-[acyl-carrier protein] reductase|nr:glucose 1-dehydrogenase [Nitrolancea sp.]